jgi:hypothetical protein
MIPRRYARCHICAAGAAAARRARVKAFAPGAFARQHAFTPSSRNDEMPPTLAPRNVRQSAAAMPSALFAPRQRATVCRCSMPPDAARRRSTP